MVFFFIAHLVKIHVSYCHQMAFVIYVLISVSFSHFNLLYETTRSVGPNLAEMVLGWFFTKFLLQVFVWIEHSWW